MIKILKDWWYFDKVIDENIILSITDKNWKIKYISDAFCKISWYEKNELIWENHRIIKHPDTNKKIFENMWHTINSWRVWKWVIKNKKKDWWYYWVRSTITPIFNNKNKIVEFISVRNDVTNLMDNIIELQTYKKAFDHSEYFVKIDTEWKVMHINQRYLKALWYKKNDILWNNVFKSFEKNKKIINLFKINSKKEKEIFCKANSWNIWKWLLKSTWKKWNLIWTKAWVIPIFDSDKNLKEYLIVQTDITDLETAKQKLKTSNRELKKLDNKKSDFLNIASHELRTPITSINWYLSMLADWDIWNIDEEWKKYINKLSNISKWLLYLINDMLDISKLEAWKIDYVKENFLLDKLINELINNFEPLIKEKNLSINYINKLDELEIYNDRNKIKQCILNLISNAIKFTPKYWKIEIETKKQKNKIVISIKDNWIWIKKEDYKVIFEKFGQIKNSLTRDISWTWLWLPIVKWILKDLGWNIEVESEESKWSCFKIILPF